MELRNWLLAITASLWAIAAGYNAAFSVAWQWDLLPRDVIMTKKVETADGTRVMTRHYFKWKPILLYLSERRSTLKHRRVDVWEVELPSGRWIDCEGTDCLAAYEKAMK